MDDTLTIGGFAFRLEGGGPLVSETCKSFTGSPSDTLVTCSGEIGPVRVGDERPALFESGGAWSVFEREAGAVRVVLRENRPERRPFQSLDLSADLLRGHAILDPEVVGGAPEPLRDPLLELWTSFLLLRGRGLLIHAAGVRTEGGVDLFVGRSGAGKTTLSRLAERHGAGRVLSDDRLVLRTDPAGGYTVWGTPWHGQPDLASPEHGPLRTIYFLEQAPASEAATTTGADATARLMDGCSLAGGAGDGAAHVLDLSARITQHAPCFVLRFTPDRTALIAAGLVPEEFN